MNKLILILCLVFGTSLTIKAQEALNESANDSYALKVEKMLELSGASKNFEVAIETILELQKESYGSILSDEFFDEIEKEIKVVGFEKLVPEFIPLYKRHLTEEDLDGIITFYESDIGKKLNEKTPLIMQEAMHIGAKWGEEIGEVILAKIEGSNEMLFNKEIETDCSKFKNGTFKVTDEFSNIVNIVERKGNIQIEKGNGEPIKFEIIWLNNNRYTLKPLQPLENGMESFMLEVNIYEVIEKGYKFIAKSKGIYLKGEVKEHSKRI